MRITGLRRTAAGIVGGAAVVGAALGTAGAASAVTPPTTVSITAPTAGATVAGTTQVTVAAPLGVKIVSVGCGTTYGALPSVQWSSQAADGTMTGSVDVSACTDGANDLGITYIDSSGAWQYTQVAVNVANPGILTGALGVTAASFTPNGDTIADTSAVYGTYLQGDTISVTVLDKRGHAVRHLTAQTWTLGDAGQPMFTATWDGRNDAGRVVKPGTYTYRIVATTAAGGSSAPETAQVTVVRARTRRGAAQVKLTSDSQIATFDHPVTSGSSFTENLVLQAPAVGVHEVDDPMSFSIVDASGAVVSGPVQVWDQYRDRATIQWDGTTTAGTRATPGQYVIVVTSRDGNITRLPITLTA